MLTRFSRTLIMATWLAAVVSPASAQTDISGSWIVTIVLPIGVPIGEVNVDTSFTQTGEKVTGRIERPNAEPLEFTGVLSDDRLSATYPVPFQGQTLAAKLTGTVEAGRMSGQLEFGGLLQAAWTARRKPQLPPPSNATTGADVTTGADAAARAAGSPSQAPPGGPTVAGTWKMALRLGAVSLPVTGRLAQSDHAVTGTMRTALGEVPVTGTVDGGHLVLRFTAQLPQGAVPVTLTGDVTPQGLAGTSSAVGFGSSDWSATRSGE